MRIEVLTRHRTYFNIVFLYKVINDVTIERCFWAEKDDLYRSYHDNEWGVPQRNAAKLFELLCLELFQAGLSWHLILKKRPALRKLFHNFEAETVASLTDASLEQILQEEKGIRNLKKVYAVRDNARVWLKIDQPEKLLWSVVGGEPVVNLFHQNDTVPCQDARSENLSKLLKAYGFKFVGPKTCYALMEASGMLNNHRITCFRREEG